VVIRPIVNIYRALTHPRSFYEIFDVH